MTWFRGDTIEDVLASCTPRTRRLVNATRERILSVVPEAAERLRGGWGLIGYNAPAYFAFVVPGPEDVRIGFEWGVMLADPGRLLEGSGRQVRYVSVPTIASLKAPALAALLRQAADIKPPPKLSRRRRPGW